MVDYIMWFRMSMFTKEDLDREKTLNKAFTMRMVNLLPVLLCLFVCVLHVRAEVKAVKLCGREFLRAVVYTCGGSRWRRAFTEPDNMHGFLEDDSHSSESPNSFSPGIELSRRDMNSILTSVCCTMGCRKSDLSLLC